MGDPFPNKDQGADEAGRTWKSREQTGILRIKTLPVSVVFGNLANLLCSKGTQKQFPTTYYFLFSSILKSLLKSTLQVTSLQVFSGG